MEKLNELKLLPVSIISKLLGVHRQTVRRWIKTGVLKGVKVGKQLYVKEDDFLNAVGIDESEDISKVSIKEITDGQQNLD